MIVDRYYYSQLNKQEQAIYKAFYNGVMAHQDIIPIPIKGMLSQTAFTKIYQAVTRDNPLIYLLNQSACNFAQDIFGHTAICPQYFYDANTIKKYNRKIEEVVNGLAGKLQLTEGSDYDKALKIHDWLCQNVQYDFQGADLNNPARVISSHNIIGVFAQRKAQCEGIAKAVKVLMNAVDLKCIVATGTTIKDGKSDYHAWNVVNINGKPYHMDVTWDIGQFLGNNKRIPYDYFNINDALISKTHKAEDKLPACVSLEANYFTKNRLVFKSKIQLLTYMKYKSQKGTKEFYIRLGENLSPSDISQEIIQIVSKAMLERGNGSMAKTQMINEEIGTYWLKIH